MVATLESYVSVVRRRLGAARHIVVTDRGGYRVDGVDTDTDRFEGLLRDAADARAVERHELLEAATTLAADDLLADEPYADWTQMPRLRYRSLAEQALIELAECRLALGDPAGALRAGERVGANERACRAAMRAHAELGDRDGALRAYEQCRAALVDTLGVPPGPDTAALHAALLADRALAEPAPAPVRYARSGDVRLAYQVVGEGPLDLVFAPSFVTNLGATWDEPTYAAFLRALAGMARLLLFDKRGTGLSDPALDFPTTRERSDDLLSVLDAAGCDRAVLFGVCGGGALCAQFAADHPERTAGVILHNSFARMLRAPDYPCGVSPEWNERFLAAFEDAWLGDGAGLVRRNPGLAANPRYRDWFQRYVRLAASPWMARRMAELNAAIDVRELLGRIRAPALVICRTGDAWLSARNSRYLAAHIAGAELLELPGADHDPWVGDTEPVLAAVASFVAQCAVGAPVPAGR
jgi:pimeloyl-ACP methyl ester carboxylesterase